MKQFIFFLIFFSFALSVHDAFSFGLASNYLENDTMLLSPGESRIYTLEIQNNDLSPLDVRLSLDSPVAKIENQKNIFKVGGVNPIQTVNLVVTLPTDTPLGSVFKVKYAAIPVQSSDNPISFNIRFNKEFSVIAVKKELPSTITVPAELLQTNRSTGLRIESSLTGAIFLPLMFLTILILALLLIYHKNRQLARRIFRK